MTPLALGLVLTAAVLHAGWNALVKGGTDRAAVLGAVSATHAVVGVVLIVSFPSPAPESWPALVVSTLVHYLYYILLFHAYRLGDLSQVYPISRGMAPALVAGLAALTIGETLSPLGWAGVAAVSLGIGVLAVQRGVARKPPRGLGVAVALGASIAVYSVSDGIGVRHSGSPLGYMGWLFLLEAPVPLTIVANRLIRGGAFAPRTVAIGLVGGLFAVTAYGLVLWVKTFAPLGAVSAVRESSVIFAALIGVLVFGERPWKGRILAACIVATGVVALAAGG